MRGDSADMWRDFKSRFANRGTQRRFPLLLEVLEQRLDDRGSQFRASSGIAQARQTQSVNTTPTEFCPFSSPLLMRTT